jgi:hypothetical protein
LSLELLLRWWLVKLLLRWWLVKLLSLSHRPSRAFWLLGWLLRRLRLENRLNRWLHHRSVIRLRLSSWSISSANYTQLSTGFIHPIANSTTPFFLAIILELRWWLHDWCLNLRRLHDWCLNLRRLNDWSLSLSSWSIGSTNSTLSGSKLIHLLAVSATPLTLIIHRLLKVLRWNLWSPNLTWVIKRTGTDYTSWLLSWCIKRASSRWCIKRASTRWCIKWASSNSCIA